MNQVKNSWKKTNRNFFAWPLKYASGYFKCFKMIIKKSLLNERILDFLNDCRTVVRVYFRKINFYNVVFPSTKLKEKAALYKGNRLSKFIPNVTTYFMEKFCLPSLNSLSLHWHQPILILEHERKFNDVPLNHQDSNFYCKFYFSLLIYT